MNINKRYILITISLLIILIYSISVISATQTNTTDTIQEDSIKEPQIENSIKYQQTDNSIKDTTKVKENNNLKTVKNNNYPKSIKQENKKEYTITNKTYSDYFDEDGFPLDKQIENSTIILDGQFTNKNFYIYDISYNITGKDAVLNNSKIEVYQPSIKISNLTINNNDTHNYAVGIINNNCIIENCTITYNTTNDVKALYIVGDNTTISNNNLVIGGPSAEIDWYSDPDLARTLAIAIVSNNNTVKYNNITTYATISKIIYGAIESITIQGSISGNRAENNIIEYNNIFTNTTDYAYGINLGQNINNNTIRYNNITTNGNLFADSIQAFSAASNLTISYNNIKSTSKNMSDGIAISKDNMAGKTQYNQILFNNITVIGNQSTLIDIGNLNQSIIQNNTGIITGKNINGIVFTGTYNNASYNTIILNSQDDKDTGILLNQAEYNNIYNNTIITNTNYTIILQNSINNKIYNNKLKNKTNSATSIYYNKINLIENNTNSIEIDTIVVVSNVTGKLNETITLSCKIVDQYNMLVNGGKVVFKINGITIKDKNGNPLYAQVKNGTATINYTIPTNLNQKQYNITVVYSGTTQYKPYRTTQNTTLTLINNQIDTIVVVSNVTCKLNETITLSCKIVDQYNMLVNGGKVVFKINGITIKDKNGNPLYAQVKNGTATINYTIPTNLNQKQYNITVVYSGTTQYKPYRTTQNTTLTIRTIN